MYIYIHIYIKTTNPRNSDIFIGVIAGIQKRM